MELLKNVTRSEKIYPKHIKLLLILYCCILMFLIIFKSWINEDAYITFRTIDNFVHGYGLRWNISERVQTFTHPLWMLLITLPYYLTHEAFLTVLSISFLINSLTIYILIFKIAKKQMPSFLILILLILSKNFIFYSTSGLENPLSHLLLVLFIKEYFRDSKRILLISFIAGLLTLNRMDNALIIFPAMIYLLFISKNKIHSLLSAATGFLPFILWELFSVFYYGFLFPNTAYAKLNNHVPLTEKIYFGLKYILIITKDDPVILIVLFTILATIFSKNIKSLFAVTGMILYIGYAIYIGGDYMDGRLLTPLIIVSLTTLHASRIFDSLFKLLSSYIMDIRKKTTRYFQNAIYFCLWGCLIGPIFFYTVHIFAITNHPSKHYQFYTISNLVFENRGMNTLFAYLFFPHEDPPKNTVPIALSKDPLRFSDVEHKKASIKMTDKRDDSYNVFKYDGLYAKQSKMPLVTNDDMGFFAYYAGPSVHIIDDFGLSDAFLSRIPSSMTNWAPGHINHIVPAGYIDSFSSQKNLIRNSSLAKYYDLISHITRGPLFNKKRLLEIINFNLGKYNSLLKDYPEIINSNVSEKNKIFFETGIFIDLKAKPLSKYILINVKNITLPDQFHEKYEITYYSTFRNEYTQSFTIDYKLSNLIIEVPDFVLNLKNKNFMPPPILTQWMQVKNLACTHILIRPLSTGNQYILKNISLREKQNPYKKSNE